MAVLLHLNLRAILFRHCQQLLVKNQVGRQVVDSLLQLLVLLPVVVELGSLFEDQEFLILRVVREEALLRRSQHIESPHRTLSALINLLACHLEIIIVFTTFLTSL